MEPDADVRSVLGRIATGPPLSESDAERLFECLLRGGLDEARIAGVLALLAAREPTPDEVVGAARAMRRHVAPVPAPDPGSIIDTCGTGGTAKTFNVSTAVALVAAGAGARVAKHGNRSRTGRGSAEVLAALGVNVDATPRVQAACLDRAGVCFCFAIHHHPAARHAAGVRRALGTPTIFNILGPLTNPAGASRQLIGVYRAPLVGLVAEALARLGSVRAMVVHSHDGLDEISLTAPTLAAEVIDGRVVSAEIQPTTILPGLDPHAVRTEDLIASDPAHSARIIRAVLAGEPGPRAEMVILNAGAALVVAGIAADLAQGCLLARRAIADGRAAAALDTLVEVSHAVL